MWGFFFCLSHFSISVEQFIYCLFAQFCSVHTYLKASITSWKSTIRSKIQLYVLKCDSSLNLLEIRISRIEESYLWLPYFNEGGEGTLLESFDWLALISVMKIPSLTDDFFCSVNWLFFQWDTRQHCVWNCYIVEKNCLKGDIKINSLVPEKTRCGVTGRMGVSWYHLNSPKNCKKNKSTEC